MKLKHETATTISINHVTIQMEQYDESGLAAISVPETFSIPGGLRSSVPG
jgi:hypothetical protein